MTDLPNPLFLDGADSFEDGATFTANRAGGLVVAVAEEQAVDSYNAMFTCNATLSREQAECLRDWLNKWFPPAGDKDA